MKKLLAIALISFISFSLVASERRFANLEGGRLSYQEIISSPRTVLFIWATWCPHCLSQMKKITRTCTFLEGVNLLYIDTGERRSLVERFADSRKLSSCVRRKVILDPDSFLARKFSVNALPTFVFLKDGKPIRKTHYLNKQLLRAVFGLEG
jgi:thiol-disulfide isomerase/thioredoxin